MPPTACPCVGCEEAAGRQSQTVPGYRLVRELGTGGFGATHLAVRLADSSAVALETLLPVAAESPSGPERFRRQADILRQLEHANVVSFRDAGEASGTYYLATEYLPGTDAAQLVKKKGHLPINQGVNVVCWLLKGLAHVHDKGFVHRDVKSANVRIAQERGRGRVVLTDFDLGRSYQASQLSGLTMTGSLGGTLSFMPPEQITDFRGAKPTADQYAAAATLYNLLTGQYLYDPSATPQLSILTILEKDPVSIRTRRPEVPEALAAVIHRALAREPKDRFPDVDAFRRALLPFARG